MKDVGDGPTRGDHLDVVGSDRNESADPFRAVFEAARDAMLLADDDGHYVEANPAACELLARDRDELLTMSLFDVSPADVDASAAWRAFLELGEMAGEYTLERPDGATIEVEFRATAHILPGVHLSVMRDVTERKRLEQEKVTMQKKLQRAQRVESLGVLATGVAHDFNTIMAKVRGHAELLREELDEHESLEAIDAAVSRALQVTERLVAFGRGRSLRPRAVHINEVVEQVRPLIEPLVAPRVIVAVELTDQADARVTVDDHLQQVLLDLIANARDAMPDGGTLTVTTGVRDIGSDDEVPELTAGRYATLQVSDTGVGMDAETQDRALDPFFTTKGPWAPSGLGLSSAYGVVTQLGGAMTIDSEPGEGTSVTVLLPIAPPA